MGSGYEFHTGYDIPAPYGSNIVAAEAGTVITASYVRGYGYTVIINHGNGLTTLYGHNSSLVVSVGQTVTRGQVIAKAGSTGNSTGNHCHFEVRVNGSHVSPKGYLGV
ncbi:MAG: M23 family metallopeptidase [Lachnospiraceae bacterium]|nr:M23 family metallopeptidase [Lachnospiraceae bacterium]